jgi:hypothetical protein
MMKRLVLTTAVTLSLAAAVWAKEPATTSNYRSELSSISPLEVPAKAAAIVVQAGDKERESVTVSVVKSVFEVNSTTCAAAVSSIARNTPEMAPVAAGTAAALQPKMAAAIARAAASAAPAQAEKIVYAVCKAVPSQYRSVALSVGQAVPNAAPDILRGLSQAVPSLKPYLDQARMSLPSSGEQTVANVLAKSDTTIAAGVGPQPASPRAFAGTQPPPVIGPPFVPLTNNVVPPEIDSGDSKPVTGPRPPDYSSP